MPRRDRSRTIALAAVLAAVSCLGAVACSTSSDSSGSTDTTVATSDTGVTESTLSNSEVEQLATSALLTAAEIGPGFTEVPHTPPPSNTPAPCGNARADSVVPPEVQVAFEAESTNQQLAFLQEIRYFNDPAQAQESFQVGSAGLGCSQGTVYGSNGDPTPVTISSPVDLTADLPNVDVATGWTISSSVFESQAVAVQMGQLVVLIQFANVIGANVADAPNPQTVTTAAIEKILAS